MDSLGKTGCGNMGLSVALEAEQLLYPVAVFPECLSCPQIALAERAPSRCTAPKVKKGGATVEDLG